VIAKRPSAVIAQLGECRRRSARGRSPGQTSLRGQAVDHSGKQTSQVREEGLSGNAGLTGELVYAIGSNGMIQLVRLDRLIGSFPEPGVDNVGIAALLQA